MAIKPCPHCGSTDTDEFEDGTGYYCFGCCSNVFNDDPNPEEDPDDNDNDNDR